jgi:hypothetical protein
VRLEGLGELKIVQWPHWITVGNSKPSKDFHVISIFADHSPPTSAEVKKTRSCISTHLYTFVA